MAYKSHNTAKIVNLYIIDTGEEIFLKELTLRYFFLRFLKMQNLE